MRNRIASLFVLLAASVLSLATASAATVTLYDASLGSLPSAQGWIAGGLGSPAVQSVSGGAYTLDTTGAGVSNWGNGRIASGLLGTATGFDLSFGLQVVSEAHTSTNRSGYSVVLTGSDPTKALEIAFWGDHVWVYDYDASTADKFIHGADASFDTTAALTSYTLKVRNNQFTLDAGSSTLLSGALRDYTASGIPPYTVPSFLFFGDDSSRGTSSSRLSFVTLSTPVPEPGSAVLLLTGLLALGTLRRHRPTGTTAEGAGFEPAGGF